MTDKTLHVLAISGSLRRASFNTAMLEAAAALAPDSMKVEIYPIHDLPMFNADLEVGGRPAAVEEFRTAVAAADALLLATPEYNWSTTPALKNAIDWASRGGSDSPLNFKPTAIMGAGGRFGTLRAQLHLREILGHNQVALVTRPEVFVDRAATKFDGEGRLKDEDIALRLRLLLEALESLVRRRAPQDA